MIWTILFWVFGVITCAYYAFETVMIGSSQSSYLFALFAPLLFIPIANAWLLLLGRSKPHQRMLAWLGTVNGIAVIVSTILVTILSPLCLLAMIGITIGLIGFFASPPVIAITAISAFYLCVAIGPIVTSLTLRRRLKKLLSKNEAIPWLPIGTCFATVLAGILIAVFPTALTQTCEAAVADRTMLPQGLLLLRAVGDSDTMLRACYSEHASVPWFFQVAYQLLEAYSSSPLNQDSIAREIYYRVKGKPFNSVPRPSAAAGGEYYYDDYDYQYIDYSDDRDFAGETVGGVVRGLSVSKSAIDGWVDSDEAVAHLYWTMHFHNAESKGKELRAQILLPPHAVISGCSLWINGIRHDAVVATRESSRQAYTISASRGGKPLLVSTAGAGRVLLQSSTGSWGSDADLMVELTTPLVLLQSDKAALPLPMFSERNFNVGCDHQISLTSITPASSTHNRLSVQRQGSIERIAGTLSNASLANGEGTLIFQRNPSITSLIAPNAADPKHDTLQRIQSYRLSSDTPLIIVVDGSSTMADSTSEVCDALDKVRCKNATIIWASDKPLTIISHIDTSSVSWKKAVSKIRDSSCLGGQNNADALSLAITESGSMADRNIVWMHGPQPVKFSGDNLLTLLRNPAGKVRLYEYQVVPGPNEVIKSLDQVSALVQVPRLGTSTEDLDALFARLAGQMDSLFVNRQSVDHLSISCPIAKHCEELSQLYVSDLVLANLSNKEDRLTYGTLAEQHGLVTPLTSALVLELKSNYAAYGVTKHTQADTTTGLAKGAPAHASKFDGLNQLAGGLIPTKPEPPMSLIMACVLLLAATFFWITRRRRVHA